jgi:hypothetical protein
MMYSNTLMCIYKQMFYVLKKLDCTIVELSKKGTP